MKVIRKTFVMLMVLVIVSGVSKTTTQASNLTDQLITGNSTEFQLNTSFDDDDKRLAVCQSTSKFPKGWVVVGQGNVDACRNNSIAQPMFNAWYIKKPTKEEFVCQGSPLPDNYVVAGEVKIADCPGGNSLIENKNGWLIKLVE